MANLADVESIITRIGSIVISLMVLYVSLQALAWNFFEPEQFLVILASIMAAWGLGIVGAGTFKLGERAGYQKGYQAGLEYAVKRSEKRS